MLGNVIGKDGVKVDKLKIEKIQQFKSSTNTTEV